MNRHNKNKRCSNERPGQLDNSYVVMTSDCQTEAGAVIDYVHTMIMSFCINVWESETVRMGENKLADGAARMD